MNTEQTRVRKGGTIVTVPANNSERIAAIRQIVNSGQYAKVDGCMIDLFSASAIINVYDALNETNQAKFSSITAPAMGKMAFKLIS